LPNLNPGIFKTKEAHLIYMLWTVFGESLYK